MRVARTASDARAHAPRQEQIGRRDVPPPRSYEFEELLRPLSLPTSLALLERSRGLIVAGAGALVLHDPTDWPLEYPRTMLVRGATLRRSPTYRVRSTSAGFVRRGSRRSNGMTSAARTADPRVQAAPHSLTAHSP